MYTVVSPGGRTRRKPVPSDVSVDVTSAEAIRKKRVDGPTTTWAIWSATTTTTPAETSRKSRSAAARERGQRGPERGVEEHQPHVQRGRVHARAVLDADGDAADHGCEEGGHEDALASQQHARDGAADVARQEQQAPERDPQEHLGGLEPERRDSDLRQREHVDRRADAPEDGQVPGGGDTRDEDGDQRPRRAGPRPSSGRGRRPGRRRPRQPASRRSIPAGPRGPTPRRPWRAAREGPSRSRPATLPP